MVLLYGATSFAQRQSADEQAVWSLEHNYWEYVKTGELERYRGLWHPDFVGWPYSSAEPVRKDNITDWIANFTGKGLRMQSYTLKPAASQATQNVVIVHYRLTQLWVDKDGRGEPRSARITHTWLRKGYEWQIIGGMSAELARPPSQ